MKAQSIRTASVLGYLIMFASMPALAQDSNSTFILSAGVDLTSGTYGGDVDIEDLYVPLSATLDYGRVAFRLTVPYLSITAPEGTIIGPGGEPLPGSGELTTESGLGDVIGSMTVYDVISNRQLNFAMDLTAKVKFGTADEDKGLGTGENDYTVRADFYKFADRLTLLGSVGYKFLGDPTDVDLDNVVMAGFGVTYKFTPEVRGGLIFDYRESAISDSDSIQELTGFVSRRISENWRIYGYALTGFTDNSPDWGAGVQIKRILQR